MRARTAKREAKRLVDKWVRILRRVVNRYENSNQLFSYMDDDFNKVLKGFILFKLGREQADSLGREETFKLLRIFMDEQFKNKENTNGIQRQN